MNAFHGDPSELMTRNPAPMAEQSGLAQAPLPPGGQSVLAAGGNFPNRPSYAPTPMGTVPEPSRQTMPPAPRWPEPPQPNAYVNAFTPASSSQNPTANAFGNMNPQANPNLMAQRNPQAPANYLPNPIPPDPRAPVFPPSPTMMANQGPPMPPQTPVQPIQYNQVAAQQPATNSAMDRRNAPVADTPDPAVAQLVKVLHESAYPAQREWAANTLATYDYRVHPDIVLVLLEIAQHDPAATVRASCVYSLGRMKAASEPVISTLYTLRNDGDARVRQEVEQALARLGVKRQ
jgi:hypothetical protein